MAEKKIEKSETQLQSDAEGKATPDLPDTHPGVEDGEVIRGLSKEDGAVDEKIVYEYDEDNNQVGWHKEPVKGKK